MINLANPINAGDAVNKSYVDGLITSSNSSLATVATSGNYNDLINKPTLGSLAALSSVSDSNINNLDYGKLFNVPSSFNPSAHTHNISDIINLSTSLSAKLDIVTFNTYVANANCNAAQTAYWNSITSQLSCQNIIFANDPINKNDPSNKNYADTFGGSRFFTPTGGTTTLLVSDTRDTIISGSLTHTFILPSTTNLQIGNWWRFVNRTNQIITVQNSALSTVAQIPSQTVAHVRVLSTGAESFAVYIQPMFSSTDGSLNFNLGKGINVGTPTTANDAANKNYVDSSISTSVANVVKSPGMTNPKSCSFFVSNGVGVETQCTSSGCTTQNINGNCANVGSVTRNSVGKYSYTFPVGYWSNGSQVNCTANFSVCAGVSGVCTARTSNSLLSTGRAFEFYDNTNTPQDASFSVICHGE